MPTRNFYSFRCHFAGVVGSGLGCFQNLWRHGIGCWGLQCWSCRRFWLAGLFLLYLNSHHSATFTNVATRKMFWGISTNNIIFKLTLRFTFTLFPFTNWVFKIWIIWVFLVFCHGLFWLWFFWLWPFKTNFPTVSNQGGASWAVGSVDQPVVCKRQHPTKHPSLGLSNWSYSSAKAMQAHTFMSSFEYNSHRHPLKKNYIYSLKYKTLVHAFEGPGQEICMSWYRALTWTWQVVTPTLRPR